MKIKCDYCKRRIDEEGMLWTKAPLDGSIWGAGAICTKCYDKLRKEGMGMVAMPWLTTVLDKEE